MKHFFANFIAMFFVSRNTRHIIRQKIMGSKPISNDNKLTNRYDQLSELENQIATQQKILDEKVSQIAEQQKILDDKTNQITAKQNELNILEPKLNYLHLKAEWLTNNGGQLLIPGRVSEYDLIFCIGATCYGTTFLNCFNLRRFSSPFEYTAGMQPLGWGSSSKVYRDTRFHEKIRSLCNNFDDWLNPEDFECVSQWIAPTTAHHHVVNTRTKIRYVHEFPANQDIMQYMPQFIEKTNRRIHNLYDAIDKSHNILILWLSNVWQQKTVLEKNVPDKDIKWAVNQINKKFPNKLFDFVFFEQDGTKKRFEYDKIEIAPGAFRIKSNHYLIDKQYNFAHKFKQEEHLHTHVISEMLDNIHLSENAFKLPDKSDINEI